MHCVYLTFVTLLLEPKSSVKFLFSVLTHDSTSVSSACTLPVVMGGSEVKLEQRALGS